MSLRDGYNPGGGGDKALKVHTQDFISQTFLTTSKYRLTDITIQLRKNVVQDSGVFHIGIFAVDENNHPTGNVLATDLTDFDNITTSFTTITFSFTGTVLSDATTYAIVCWTTGRNDIFWYAVETGTYGNGAVYFSYDTGASYGSASAIDCIFLVFGTDPEPGIATTPSPTDAITNQPSDITLSWVNGSVTDTIDMYFDDFTPPTTKVIDNQDATTYDPGGIAESDTFYWRVDCKNAHGTTTGTIWSFETGPQIAISNKAELQAIKDNPTASYYLTGNIDISGAWTPIGNLSDGFFTGILDGRGFTVSNLTLSNSSNYQGLFGIVDSAAVIFDLTVEDVSMTVGGPGGCLIGLAGSCFIINVHVTGTSSITSAGSTLKYFGGLIGQASNNCTIYNCSSNADVSGALILEYLGGLIGFGSGTFDCQKSFATGDITSNSLAARGGGFIADLNSGGSIADCYATGAVNVNGTAATSGGFVGRSDNSASVITSYSKGAVTGSSATIGGFCGFKATGSGPLSNDYYDSTTSGQSDTGKGIPKTTANMKKFATFENWEF